jgi:hypothetical protein
VTVSRRATSLVCAAVLLSLLQPSRAATPEREVAVAYQGAGGTTTGTATTTPDQPTARVTARADENRVTLSVQDSSGGAVALAVDLTPPGAASATRHLLCSAGALAVRGGTTVAVTPLLGRCADGRPSLPRGGSITLSFHRRPAVATDIATPAHRFALVVGIKDYAGRTHETVGGVGDVLAVRRALIGSGWESSHILTLTDSDATAANIRAGLTWLAAHSTPDTFSLFHYSGHVCIASRGPCADGHAYLWSYDNSFIPDDEVVSRLKQVKGKQWLDLSACEGGAFDRGYSSPDRLFTGASQPNETAYEEPHWNESVWTGLTWDYGYNRGLADPQGVGLHATIAQMASYGVSQAPSYTHKQARGPQHPVFRGGSDHWSLAAPPGR